MHDGPPAAVVFDLGGVLIDWNPRYLYRGLFADEAAMERFLAEVATAEWNATMDAGRPFAESVEALALEHPEQAALIRAYDARWAEMLGGTFDGTITIVRELLAAGVPVFALSNWSREKFAVARPLYPFLEELAGVLISGEVGVNKPDERIFRLMLERFGLDADRTVFVDDNVPNVEAARRMGMIALRFVGPERLRQDLADLGLLTA